MQTKVRSLFTVLALLSGVYQATAQSAQFFRIAGPNTTTITLLRGDGTIVWSNATPGVVYTVQSATSLAGGSNWVDYVQLPASNNVGTNLIFAVNPPAGMALVPAGQFTIGNSIGDSDITIAIPTNVYVSAFYMDINLMSYAQWQSVYNWATNRGYQFALAGLADGTNFPVESIDWYDCVKWCNARSQVEGLTPMYYTDSALTMVYTNGPILFGSPTLYVNWSANGYRLPTEAEWEKAARGGLSGKRFPLGNTISWSQADYFGYPQFSGSTVGLPYDLATEIAYDPAFPNDTNDNAAPIGIYPANGYGLHDMAGNLMEFCWDWYATPPYPAGSPYLGGSDPTGPATQQFVVMRGGSWYNNASFARCAFRDYSGRGGYGTWIGFRCVRRP